MGLERYGGTSRIQRKKANHISRAVFASQKQTSNSQYRERTTKIFNKHMQVLISDNYVNPILINVVFGEVATVSDR